MHRAAAAAVTPAGIPFPAPRALVHRASPSHHHVMCIAWTPPPGSRSSPDACVLLPVGDTLRPGAGSHWGLPCLPRAPVWLEQPPRALGCPGPAWHVCLQSVLGQATPAACRPVHKCLRVRSGGEGRLPPELPMSVHPSVCPPSLGSVPHWASVSQAKTEWEGAERKSLEDLARWQKEVAAHLRGVREKVDGLPQQVGEGTARLGVLWRGTLPHRARPLASSLSLCGRRGQGWS